MPSLFVDGRRYLRSVSRIALTHAQRGYRLMTIIDWLSMSVEKSIPVGRSGQRFEDMIGY